MFAPELSAALTQRFRHFDAERCASIFHVDQEEDGQWHVREQGRFPAVRMTNGVIWFYDPERRPRRLNREGRDVGVMKSRAPRGERHLLVADPSADELVFVEGEGHAVALVSCGVPGVVACGGVNVFQTHAGWAQEELTRIVRGKRVRLCFDFDEAGVAATREILTRLRECGATRVSALPPQEDWGQGADVEDWLATFDSGVLAYGALINLLGSLEWIDNADAEAEQQAIQAVPERPVLSERVDVEGADTAALVVTVYNEETSRLELAVLGPASDEPIDLDNASVRHDAAPEATGLGRGWQLLEQWIYQDVRWVPEEGGTLIKDIKRRAVIMPAPPADGYGSSETLWAEIVEFMQRWLVLRTREQYDVLTSYVLMTYRIFDAEFQYVPYLRFHGPPGTGKGRALDVMKALSWRSLDAQPTADNIHRVIEFFGEITLCVDEFHLDRGFSRETIERTIDTLNLGNDRSKGKLRCDNENGRMVVRNYNLFGPKIFAGYGYDEHEALARRTVNIDMSGIEVPKEIALFALPQEFHAAAYQIRRKLLTWKGEKFTLGMPDPTGKRAMSLMERAGREVGQMFWPLLEMVPASMPDAMRAVYEAAERRRGETRKTRAVSDDSYLLEAVAEMIDEHIFHELKGTKFIRTSDLALRLQNEDAGSLARRLKKLGLTHGRRRIGTANPVGGIILNEDQHEKDIFNHHSIEWPRDVAEPKEPAL